MKTKTILGIGALALATTLATPARADIRFSFNLGIPLPPPFVVRVPPPPVIVAPRPVVLAPVPVCAPPVVVIRPPVVVPPRVIHSRPVFHGRVEHGRYWDHGRHDQGDRYYSDRGRGHGDRHGRR